MSETEAPKKTRTRAPKKPKEASPPAAAEAAPPEVTVPDAGPAVAAPPASTSAQERAPRMYGNLFRSAGELAAHECPNGHGATQPVAPHHTWCGQCLQHWTVVTSTPVNVT